MNRRANVLTALALLLIGLAAWAMGNLASRQTLGRPGVKLSNIPLLGEGGRLVRTNSVALPSQILGYEFQTKPVKDVELNSLPQDTIFGRGDYIASDGFWARLSIVLMGTDRTSIHRPEYCLTGDGWKIVRQDERSLASGGKPGAKVQRFDCRLKTLIDGQRTEVGGVYVFWFVAQDRQTSSHWQRQWWMIRELVTRGVLQRWAYISFFAPCLPGQEDATYERLTQLIQATSPYFEVTDDLATR
ncbi:MAG TPA: exosortase-associated EpsI family protein [Verrucomicrobiota bacterium]|nr:hypothetical protein [Verrucomicrobiales bacterium]HRI16252.1 exosortase-associated EpsI family protein [Verrucomicrobiota bacterium]